jgi:hypothetical protein
MPCHAVGRRLPARQWQQHDAWIEGCDTAQYTTMHRNNSIAGVQRAACSKQQQRQRGCSRCLADSAPAPAPVCVCVGARVAVCQLCSSEFCASAMAITMAITGTITGTIAAAAANAKPKPNPPATATALAGPSTGRVGLLIAGAGLVLVAGQAQSPPSPPARRATSLVLQLSRRRRLPRL